MFSRIKSLAAVVVLSAVAAAPVQAQNGARTYEVTITNVTQAILFTPIIGVMHNNSVNLFELGERPSEALAMIAEGGDTSAMNDALQGARGVGSVTNTTGLLAAGESVRFQMNTDGRQRLFSMAAMLLPTNDTFVGLDGVVLPNRGSRTFQAAAYDAGSEVNDQLCANIPGPQCGGDGSFDSISGEGFVHVSNGIHDQGNLPGGASVYDWRNPVAVVTVRRVN